MKLFLWLFFIGLAMGLSPYIVFGLAEDATEEQVQKKYQKLIKKLKKNSRERIMYEAAYKEIIIDNALNDEPTNIPSASPQNIVDLQTDQTAENKKAAQGITFLIGILLKLLPCFLVFFCCKKYASNNNNNPIPARRRRR